MIVYLKSEEEIEGFKKAGSIAGSILAKVLAAVDVGKTTKELDDLARQECEKAGVNPIFLGYQGFPAAICASVNNQLVHGVPDHRPLEVYDVLSIDIGVEIDGFIGDTADTVQVGRENLYSDLLIHSCQQALKLGISQAKPGKKLADIANMISVLSKDYQIPSRYGGHGVSRHILHAPPFVANRVEEAEDLTIRSGMVIAIEPMFVDGDAKTSVAKDEWTVVVGGTAAHCEHTILVTDDKPIVLTARKE
jgi:methionyl aminopeptidase